MCCGKDKPCLADQGGGLLAEFSGHGDQIGSRGSESVAEEGDDTGSVTVGDCVDDVAVQFTESPFTDLHFVLVVASPGLLESFEQRPDAGGKDERVVDFVE